MKIILINCSNPNNFEKIRLLNQKISYRNKYRYRIIYNNKIFLLQSTFLAREKENTKIKFKLIVFSDDSNIDDLKAGIESIVKFKEIKNYKKNWKKFVLYINIPFFNLSEMVYSIKEDEVSNIKIFGNYFVNNNRKKCLIIHKNKIYRLKEYFSIEDIDKNENKLELYLLEIDYIKQKSYMFNNCKSLEKFSLLEEEEENAIEEKDSVINNNYDESESSEFYNEPNSDSEIKKSKTNIGFLSKCFLIEFEWDYFIYKVIIKKFSRLSLIDIPKKKIHYVNSLKSMFYNCSSLKFLGNLTYWDISNVNDMRCLFHGCSSLKCLPDLSNWKTNNVEYMDEIFYGCKALISLPNIYKWVTKKLISMNKLFYGCSSLISLPDISKWNTFNITSIEGLFYGCSSLVSLPHISKWKFQILNNLSYLFYGCSSLVSLPHISKWKFDYLENISYMFYGCKSLVSLPDISKWKFDYLENIKYMFYGCSSLVSIPDISKWKFNNIKNISYLFYECSSLISLPDISKWKLNNIENISYLFYGCSSLISLPDISKWNTGNVQSMEGLFFGCSSLISIPDISKWKFYELENISYIFFRCSSLLSIPNIFKWDFSNLKEMKSLFDYCTSLISLPPVFPKFEIQSTFYIDNSFTECISLINFPNFQLFNESKNKRNNFLLNNKMSNYFIFDIEYLIKKKAFLENDYLKRKIFIIKLFIRINYIHQEMILFLELIKIKQLKLN